MRSNVARIGGRAALQPTGEALVELGPLALGQRGVGRVADEEVAEAIRLVVGEVRSVGADQVAAGQLRESSRELRPLAVGKQARRARPPRTFVR